MAMAAEGANDREGRAVPDPAARTGMPSAQTTARAAGSASGKRAKLGRSVLLRAMAYMRPHELAAMRAVSRQTRAWCRPAYLWHANWEAMGVPMTANHLRGRGGDDEGTGAGASDATAIGAAAHGEASHLSGAGAGAAGLDPWHGAGQVPREGACLVARLRGSVDRVWPKLPACPPGVRRWYSDYGHWLGVMVAGDSGTAGTKMAAIVTAPPPHALGSAPAAGVAAVSHTLTVEGFGTPTDATVTAAAAAAGGGAVTAAAATVTAAAATDRGGGLLMPARVPPAMVGRGGSIASSLAQLKPMAPRVVPWVPLHGLAAGAGSDAVTGTGSASSAPVHVHGPLTRVQHMAQQLAASGGAPATGGAAAAAAAGAGVGASAGAGTAARDDAAARPDTAAAAAVTDAHDSTLLHASQTLNVVVHGEASAGTRTLMAAFVKGRVEAEEEAGTGEGTAYPRVPVARRTVRMGLTLTTHEERRAGAIDAHSEGVAKADAATSTAAESDCEGGQESLSEFTASGRRVRVPLTLSLRAFHSSTRITILAAPMYARADAVVIVFAVDDAGALGRIADKLERMRRVSPRNVPGQTLPAVLVANKADLRANAEAEATPGHPMGGGDGAVAAAQRSADGAGPVGDSGSDNDSSDDDMAADDAAAGHRDDAGPAHAARARVPAPAAAPVPHVHSGRLVSRASAAAFAASHGMGYCEVSARYGTNVDVPFLMALAEHARAHGWQPQRQCA